MSECNDEVFTQEGGVICRKTFDLMQMHQQLEETQEKLKITVDALEFYREINTEFILSSGFRSQDHGNKARQALEKIKGM